MKKAFSIGTVLSFLMAVWILQAPSIGYAQSRPTANDCTRSQEGFVSAIQLFYTAFFERANAVGTAESVLKDRLIPSAEEMYQVCPAETIAAVKAGVEKAEANLKDPNRPQLVACDKALTTYQGNLRRFDTKNLSSYADYRNLLYSEIDPSAQTAVGACPQMTDLAKQARLEILERQRRLDSMEDIDRQGPSYWDTRDDVEESNAAYDAATE